MAQILDKVEDLKKSYKNYYKRLELIEKFFKDMENNLNPDYILYKIFIKDKFLSKNLERIKDLKKKFESSNLIISVLAEVSNGKSTFLNSLIFKNNILDSGIGAITSTLFKIEYGEKYHFITDKEDFSTDDIKEFKDKIKKYNKFLRKLIKEYIVNKSKLGKNIYEKFGKIEKFFKKGKEIKNVTLKIPNENLKKGIILYDTPGFQSLDEEIIFPILKEVLEKSDAIIILFDISQGLKKEDLNFIIENTLKDIKGERRYIIFNKMDAIINDDMREIMDEKEIEEEIENIKNEAIEILVQKTNIPKEEFKTYILSSLKALSGYIKNNKDKLKESKFLEFEEDFWRNLIEYKKELFKRREKEFYKIYDLIVNTLEDTYVSLERNKERIEKILLGNLKKLENIERNLTYYRKDLKEIINNDLKKIPSTIFEIIDLKTIESIISTNILENLNNNIGELDRIAVWSLKKKYIKEIEKAIKSSIPRIENLISNNLTNFMRKYYENQNKINSIIRKINNEFNKFEQINLSNIKEINLIQKDSETFRLRRDIFNEKQNISIYGEYFSKAIISSIIGFFSTALVGGVIFLLWAIFSKLDNNEISKNVTQNIMKRLKENIEKDLANEIEIFKYLNNKINLIPRILEENIRSVLRSLTNKEKELEKIKNELSEINHFRNRIKNI